MSVDRMLIVFNLLDATSILLAHVYIKENCRLLISKTHLRVLISLSIYFTSFSSMFSSCLYSVEHRDVFQTRGFSSL